MTEHSPNDQFHASAFIDGVNADYIDQLAVRHAAGPASVDAGRAEFFRVIGNSNIEAMKHATTIVADSLARPVQATMQAMGK